MTTPTNPPPTAPASAEPSHVEAFVRWARSNGLDVEFSADAGRVFADYLTELCYLATQEVPYSGARAALDSQAAERLSCGHPAELMQYSAETGAPLYCELCDDKSGRRDAERREMELQAELAALRASAASVQADQRDSLRYRIWREHFAGATSCEISGLMIALADSWTPEAVDAAIDAALAAKGEGAPPAPGGAA